jgi:hypothetical protein
MAVLIILFDINENLTRLAVTDALARRDDTNDLLSTLHIATWLKWAAIALSMGGFALGLLIVNVIFQPLLVLLDRLVSSYIGYLVVMLSWQS